MISKRCDDDTANVLSLSPQPTMSSAQLTVLKTSPSHSNSAPLQESLRTQPIGLILPSESSTNDVCELLVTTPGSYLPEDSEVDSSEVPDLVDIEVCSELQPITKEDRLELPHTLLENCGTTQQDEERAESPSGSEANSSLPSSKIASTDNEGIQKVTLRRGSGTCTKKSKIWDRDSLKKATELHQAGKVVLRFIDNGELHLSKILCSRELLTVLFGRENFRTRPNQLLLKHFSPYDITDRCNSRTLFRSRVFSFKVSSKLFNYGKHCLNFIEKGESGTVTPPANYLHRIPSSTQSSFEESRNVEPETNQKPSVSGRAAPSFGHLFSKISMHSQEVRRAIESHFEQSPAPRPIEDNRNEDTGIVFLRCRSTMALRTLTDLFLNVCKEMRMLYLVKGKDATTLPVEKNNLQLRKSSSATKQ